MIYGIIQKDLKFYFLSKIKNTPPNMHILKEWPLILSLIRILDSTSNYIY